MSRAEIVAQLRAWIKAFAIAPGDAADVLAEIDDELDADTFAEYLEFAGYPNLAEELLAR